MERQKEVNHSIVPFRHASWIHGNLQLSREGNWFSITVAKYSITLIKIMMEILEDKVGKEFNMYNNVKRAALDIICGNSLIIKTLIIKLIILSQVKWLLVKIINYINYFIYLKTLQWEFTLRLKPTPITPTSSPSENSTYWQCNFMSVFYILIFMSTFSDYIFKPWLQIPILYRLFGFAKEKQDQLDILLSFSKRVSCVLKLEEKNKPLPFRS